MSTPTYNAAYFIAKFSAIPDELWCTKIYSEGEKHCTLGHLGITNTVGMTDEYKALLNLELGGAATITDGDNPRYPQPTPKQRILAALRDAQEAGR